MNMNESILFLVGTAVFVWISRHSLLKPLSHGFYRFIAWECMLVLALLNFPMRTFETIILRQATSWMLIMASLILAVHAVSLLSSRGRPNEDRSDPELLSFEKTSTLVTTGAYRYIRHPMYAALLFLAWGAFLKDISLLSIALVVVASIAIFFAALREEAECREYFGAPYVEYLKRSKRFIPFLF
ncbi:MAG: isoprenylcysteine carboxylmethyltransferase family protein [Deltaproteobacteria bacterium]|nr:isoprenylcysteine carboxylmethyltransferase family protein [Deltaproteobacteria bacterium]